MISNLLDLTISKLDDPLVVGVVGWTFVASYYVASWGFISHNKAGYQGPWRKNGWIDRVTSIMWAGVAVFLIMSLVVFLVGHQISLPGLLNFYFLFLFTFAFVYNILEWHFPGSLNNMQPGWPGEIQCLLISLAAMTTASYPSAAPKSLLAECISGIQTLLGVAFVAIFIAKAVSAL